MTDYDKPFLQQHESTVRLHAAPTALAYDRKSIQGTPRSQLGMAVLLGLFCRVVSLKVVAALEVVPPYITVRARASS